MPNPIASSAIRAELARRGLRQVDIAEKLGIDPAQVGRRMNGDIDWRLTELQVIAAMLELPVSALVDEPAAERAAS